MLDVQLGLLRVFQKLNDFFMGSSLYFKIGNSTPVPWLHRQQDLAEMIPSF